MPANADFQKAIDNNLQDVDALFTLFDSLPVASEEMMWGEWRGDVFYCGHPGEQQLQTLKWTGKNFHSRNNVNPIVVSGENGEREVSDLMGQASLREVRYRQKVSATMIYDNSPTMDYFRKVDDNTVMGVMDHKGDDLPLFFYLQRI